MLRDGKENLAAGAGKGRNGHCNRHGMARRQWPDAQFKSVQCFTGSLFRGQTIVEHVSKPFDFFFDMLLRLIKRCAAGD